MGIHIIFRIPLIRHRILTHTLHHTLHNTLNHTRQCSYHYNINPQAYSGFLFDQFVTIRHQFSSTVNVDKRYEPQNPVPSRIIEAMHSETIHSPGFSIKGENEKFNLYFWRVHVVNMTAM